MHNIVSKASILQHRAIFHLRPQYCVVVAIVPEKGERAESFVSGQTYDSH